MEFGEISKIIDQLKTTEQCSHESGIQLTWMDGWIQFSSFSRGMNFSSVATLAKWLSKQTLTSEGKEEMKMPDEGAFMASMDAWSHQGVRSDQTKFKIYYHETSQLSPWDNYHCLVDENNVTEIWRDYFNLDAPANDLIKRLSFDDYFLNGSNYAVLEYLAAEGLVSINAYQKKYNNINSAELLKSEALLKEAFEKAIYKITKNVPKDQFWLEIRSSYREGGRFYHNLIHLAAVFNILAPFQNEVEDWETIVLAIVYHDIIYDVTNQDNEEQSATIAKRNLHSLRVNLSRINRCANHILATKYHQLSNDNDTNLLIDADLSILGSRAEVYQKYSEAIRQEYSIFHDSVYNEGRVKVLRKFLEIPSIFKTESFQNRYEKQARLNIEGELQILISQK